MYRLREIQQRLLPLVGWEQSFNPETAINEMLTRSESGLTFQGAHPLCTLNNVRSIMPDDYYLRYPEWVYTRTYAEGAKVRHGNRV